MCLNPITIRNPKFKKTSYISEKGALHQLPNHITPQSEWMKVPCNKCVECRATKYNAILQRGLVESMTSWSFLITLTFDNEHIPVFTFPDGHQVYYTDYSLVQLLFKRLRDSGVLGSREFRYIASSEFGETRHRPHIHINLFVAKLDGDSEVDGDKVRDILYKNIKKLWVVNTGTRGKVNYQPLFTYRRWWNAIENRYDENYKVDRVKPTQDLFAKHLFSYDKALTAPDLGNVKSTQYVLGYVQKPSEFDLQIEDYLQRYKDDKEAFQWLSRLLKSRVVYSKGLGCGFYNGKKYYLPRISVRCSSNVMFYTTLVDSLPKTYAEFTLLYPDQDTDFRIFKASNYYRKYRKSTWKKCISSMTTDQYINHCIYVKYFKEEFTNVYRSYFRRETKAQPKVSFLYTYAHRNSYYQMQTVRTVAPEKSLVYTFLRKGVEEGIAAKVPYLAFKMIGQQKFTALCRYFKERVCTYEDTLRMYEAVGVKNFEEWQALFEKQRSNRKSNLFNGNKAKYYNEHKKITQTSCKIGKNYLYLHNINQQGIINYLESNSKVTNCKASNLVQKGV